LVTALESVDIRADEEAISRVECWLRVLLFNYHSRKHGLDIGRSKPSNELKKLDKGFREWLNSDARYWEANLLSRGNGFTLSSIESLSNTISKTILMLESVRNQTRQEDLETDLARDLYRGYVELSGKKGLWDNCPAIKFIRCCLSILNVEIVEDFRRRLEQSIARNKSRVPIEIKGMGWFDPIEILRRQNGVERVVVDFSSEPPRILRLKLPHLEKPASEKR
jgi:hypothetical protein